MKTEKKIQPITILTNPIPGVFDYYSEKIKSQVRPILRKIDKKAPIKKKKYGGHYAVTRSLIEGLQKENIPFVYNPGKLSQCTSSVVVLSGLDTLEQAINLKEKGKIKKLAAGPNLVVMPSDAPELIGHPSIDIYILNSEWTKAAYCKEMPVLCDKTIIWPAGVNEEAWVPPAPGTKRNNILFYLKNENEPLYKSCRDIVLSKGLHVSEIVYGKYTPAQYKHQLAHSKAMVYFSMVESQGIALQEAWAMNVPSLVWNPGEYTLNDKKIPCSSAPYLTGQTGLFFSDASGFEKCMNKITAPEKLFSPREWILKNMTDKISAQNLISKITGFN